MAVILWLAPKITLICNYHAISVAKFVKNNGSFKNNFN